MADGLGDPATPNLNLTPEEKRIYGQLFRQADSDNIGVVTGEAAVKFFEKTGLEPRILGEIWQIADSENRGLLTPAGFGIVLRLIGHFQAGREPTRDLAFRPGPLPKFDGGYPGALGAVQPPPGPPPSALQPQASGSGPIRVPPLTPDKVAQYSALFEKSGAQNGLLPGEQAKQIFEKAGLPNDVLVRIWNLADTEQRGALASTEFVIAMHLIASFKSGAMRALPALLPAGLYEAATRRLPVRPVSGSPSPAGPIPRQYSGAGRAGSPLAQTPYTAPISQQVTGQSPYATPLSQQTTGQLPQNNWAITPADKARFDKIYAGLDRTNRGFITGDEAVPFFSESKLSEEALAQIWDLSDINQEGRLTRDEFAVAMYLIRQQRTTREPLPATLPPALVPPSLRNQARAPPPPAAAAFDAPPPPPAPKSAADDLFGLDAFTSSQPVATPAPAQVPLSTGGSNSFGADPFNPSKPLTPTSPVRGSPAPPAPSSSFKPFVPSSSFGQTLTQQPTGGSNVSGTQVPPNAPKAFAVDDLLGDNDPEVSKKLTNETTELANLSNQVGTLSKQMQEVQNQRTTTQQELAQSTSQKREFEVRLAQLRTLYEQEVKDVRSLEERLNASRQETAKLQQEMAMLDGTYQDLQNQHRQVVTALQADQQENASLKERMRVVNAEIAQLKPQLEKLRSEARQQKGLAAINKKQLATSEGERDKVKNEISDLSKSNEEARSRASSPQSPVASPAPSTTNPFFRRQGSTSESAPSPFAGSPVPSFENVFGPSFVAAAAGTETPPPRQDSFHNAFASPAPVEANEQPPPPPESRQLSSSFLPLPLERTDSLSSSRQVSAPASRYEGSTAGADTPTNFSSATPTGSVGPGELPRGASPVLTRNMTGSSIASGPSVSKDPMPGSFPDFKATPSGASNQGETADPFGSNKEVGNAKDDFDAAFAGFGNGNKSDSRPTTSNDASAPSAFNSEFPPIAELENDDDSDSASESGNGFDDDFTAASAAPAQKAPSPEHAEQTSNTQLGNDLAPSTGASSELPTPNAQVPPPSYDKTISPSEQAHAEVQQYSGLLPTREEPTLSPPAPQPSFASSAGSGSFFNVANQPSAPSVPAKTSFDDFDNDFDGLEDAKEGDGDEDFTHISVNDRSGVDDFNPVFDSPAASKTSGHTAHDSSAFSDNFQFTQSPTQSSNAPAPTGAPVDNQDWDAIFAGLDSPSAQATTHEEGKSSPQAQANASATNHASSSLSPPGVNGSAGNADADRPQVGRALTETGEHDDPILKNLTVMGYKRSDALAALEKYDYNLERAANYLASQS